MHSSEYLGVNEDTHDGKKNEYDYLLLRSLNLDDPCRSRLMTLTCTVPSLPFGIDLGCEAKDRSELTVVHVQEKSPADRAGVREGDRLVYWAGQHIRSAYDVEKAHCRHPPFTVVFLRRTW
eukprot:TRINITY_DN46060_c0_g1_i1.p1 TRINITY_DN46060_c0_g1~~TRINITY_DN46060_c0_g1_i1.p1  ORF type:complete len:121 (+),score=15.73 TRINITY_DN46060_c0_g1_i1:71-433(+)